LATGAVAFERTFPNGRYLLGTWAFSDDGMLALYTLDGGGAKARGIEVWDVAKNSLKASATLPPSVTLARNVYLSRPYFDDTTRSVAMDVVKRGNQDPFNTCLRWLTLHLDTGVLDDDPHQVLSDPPNAGEGTVLACDPRPDGYQLWVAERSKPFSLWWCLQRYGRVLAPWRQWPFSGQESRFGVHGYPMGVHVSARASILSPPNQLLFETDEAAPASVIPTTIRDWIPNALRMPWSVRRFRWHNWATGEWRDVGYDTYYGHLYWTENAFIGAGVKDGQLTIESWPLPPRDPKPPALAIAALCMGGAWWLCAWRYRRRKRLAAVGAV